MREVGANEASLAEFERAVDVLDKFRRKQTVSPHDLCCIPNNATTGTECELCGSLADCIKELPEQPETVRARLIEPARRLLRTRRRAWPQALRRATGSRGDADASFAGRCVSF